VFLSLCNSFDEFVDVSGILVDAKSGTKVAPFLSNCMYRSDDIQLPNVAVLPDRRLRFVI
jgi:hypothetical protein